MFFNHRCPRNYFWQDRLFCSVFSCALLAIILMSATVISEAQTDVNDGHGKEWRQLPPTVGMSWNQVSQVCPLDGVGRCSGPALGKWTRQQILRFYSL